ncbi:phosphoribosylformylglycinamidine synthase [Blattabacterium cuenoti]|uniref:phosphoribosylformylglycinamidine synthase n=1 Tax=Blattabacterium cuenoti TaxID=1653831 RepID=UPI00163C2C9D|nr:phosphoribosylformylglycinamidine synthase [Blattabacterium cuenoti]
MILLSKKRYFKVYIKKRSLFDTDSSILCNALKNINIPIKKIIIYYIYDIFYFEKKLIIEFLKKILVDPVTEIVYINKNINNPYIEYILNNSEYRSYAAMQCFRILNSNINNNDICIKSKILIELIGGNGFVKKKCIKKIKEYIKKNYSYNEIKKIQINKNNHTTNKIVKLNDKSIRKIHKKLNLSIDINDLFFIKNYFCKEKRDPKESELKIIDTYWSDHCRHTTFFTEIEKISFNGSLKKIYQNIFKKYIKDKKIIGKSKYPINLMEISKLPYEIHFFKKRKNYNFYHSENNACMISIDVDIILSNKKKKEKWFLFFKNETHNFPTEIDPFNGASTCIGGAIRDPLSGRSFVFQGIRLSGAADPNIKKKIKGKLSQKKICFESACGYSSYGNQVGIATTHVNEIYHEGYRAKRMEIGMVVGAVPCHYVRREKPNKGDVVLLIGGKTGKEGVGDASNSSKIMNNNETINDRNKQKGDPITERKIQRLFRKKKITSLIKKCNDVGAGGIAVALGEIHNSIEVYLEKVPLKNNEIISPIEIALSESQERMIVVINYNDLNKFIRLSKKENLNSIPIAKITDNNRIIFFYKNKEIFNVKSSFLNTKGCVKKNEVIVNSPKLISPFKISKKQNFNKKNFLNILSKPNIASQIGLTEMFDSTVGGTTVLMPFGGKYQMTPNEGSVQKIPVIQGSTSTVTIASWGFHPYISTWSPFHGGAYAVLECISKIVSMGGSYKNIYLSFQEYYQKLGNDPEKWGKPFSALLGAYHAQKSMGSLCIGGKDSMSGTYKNIHVPPTLIVFGITTDSFSNIISSEFKKVGNKIYLYNHSLLENEMPNFNSIKYAYDKVYKEICLKKIVSVKTIKDGGISVAIAKMSFGNNLGVNIHCDKNLLETHIGSLIIESSYKLSDDFILIGEVVDSKYLNFNKISISIEESIKNWSKTLTPIFSLEKKQISKIFKTKNKILCKKRNIFFNKLKLGSPNVFIPIFPGTNGEFESIKAFEKSGALVKTFVFKNLNNKDIINSIFYIKKYIESVQIFMICGGFSFGDEPNGAAKFIVSILHNPYIKESIKRFLDKDGLILGICNGFQGLIKSGLLPYGKISLRNKFSPSLIYNKTKKHISQCVYIKVLSDKSPWLSGMKNKIYTLPISHGEGRFYAKKNIINILFENNQIAAQYVDLNGNPSLNRKYNPNGSINSVEGLLSENGKIYGRMTHPERCFDHGLLKNIPKNQCESIFDNAVKYFL